jgi:hypothetical protein
MALFRRRATPAAPSDAPVHPTSEIRGPVVPPVDLNVPVTNPEVIEAVKAYAADPSDVRGQALDVALRRSVLLAATRISELQPTPGQPGQSTVPVGSTITIATVLDDRDRSLLALFTDWQSLEAQYGPGWDSLVLPAADAFDLALKQHAGAVLNPSGPEVSVPLEHPQLRRILAVPDA